MRRFCYTVHDLCAYVPFWSNVRNCDCVVLFCMARIDDEGEVEMETVNHLAKRIGLFFTTLFLAATCLFSAPNEAEAGEFEIMGAFGYVALPDSDSEVDLNGLAFSLGFGYRINSWFGIALEQDLGGLFYDKNHLDIDWFYGATMFEAKFFIGLVKNLELSGKVGIGATYVADKYRDGGVNKRWDTGWFAIRLGAGLTYFIMGTVGLGLNLDYTPSIANDEAYYREQATGHFVKLQAHVIIKF